MPRITATGTCFSPASAWDATMPQTSPCKCGGSSRAMSDPSFFYNYYCSGVVASGGPSPPAAVLGLRHYDHLPTPCACWGQVLVQQGAALLQLTWGVLKQVPENYHAWLPWLSGRWGHCESVLPLGRPVPGFVGLLEHGGTVEGS